MILVSGGTGLLGSHLLCELALSVNEIFALKRKSSDLSRVKHVFSYYSDEYTLLFEKIKWLEADVLDYLSLKQALKGAEKVYHCAATVSFESADKNTLINTNVEGTANMVNACLENNIKKLVHVSSIGTLGRAGAEGIVTEETPWNDKKTSVYSKSKYEAELEVWRGMAEGLNAVIINPSIILGPGFWNSGSSKLFKTMHDGLKFYTAGSNGFVDVQDVAKIMIELMNSDICNEKFIISSENIKYKDLFFKMAEYLKVKPPKYFAGSVLSSFAWRTLWFKKLLTGKQSSITRETAETAQQTYRYSNEKITSALGYKFLGIEESLKKNAELFLKDNIA